MAQATRSAKLNGTTGKTFRNLRIFNFVMVGLHAAQGVVMLVLASDFSLPVTAGFLKFNAQANQLESASEVLFEVPLVWLVAGFLFMSALAHLIIATVYRKRYERDLALGINRARWFEYALSASTMIVAIAMLVGLYDLGSLLMIFGLVAVMNLMGLVMEVHNQTTKKTKWLSYNVGVFAGLIPWVVIALMFWAGAYFGAGEVPTFVYWIYVSIFVFFNGFAINMLLQYKKVGKWRNYIYGERVYIILSLVAKSLLAWQVFAGTLRQL